MLPALVESVPNSISAPASELVEGRAHSDVESPISRMDVVLTTHLYGTVLSLKNGVPVIAIDPIAGGAKIRRQAETIGWPIVFTADAVSDKVLYEALDYCLTEGAREKAGECGKRARRIVASVPDELVAALLRPDESER